MSDELKRRILRAEATLLRVPIFALAVKGSATLDGFEYRHTRRRGESKVDLIIRTERDRGQPYPGPLARRVHMAVLSLIAERGFPFANPVEWTWRELCRRMGLPNSGRRVGELKAAMRATWGLKIFGLATADGRTHEAWRRLYAECEFQNEPRADGSVADANRLWLAPWYLDSLNALHSAPVDYELWKRLERVGPIASRMYEYLLPAFYKNEALELAYDRLASAMPVVGESRRSHAIRQFEPALKALSAERVLASFGWDAMKGTGRPKLVLARGALIGPRAPAAEKGPADAPGEPPAADPHGPERLAHAFYRLLGRETRPLRSDLAVSRDLIARFGPDRAAELLPDAVRLLKARFRNAETMGALVRYFEEAVERAGRQQRAEQARAEEEAKRAAEHARLGEEDARRRAVWESLPESWREVIRAAVLEEQPLCRRFPALLEAACLARLGPEGPANSEGGPPAS
jgi:hypothetical protein